MKKNTRNKLFYYAVFALFLIGVLFMFWRGTSNEKIADFSQIRSVQISGQEVFVDLAITGEQKMQGLSGKTGLGEDEGMLFVFDTVGKYTFWMKDMKFPIDIIWIDGDLADLRVVYIEKNAKPESYPDVFSGTVDSRYVLEVNAGFSEKNNLKVGDKVEFLP